VGPSTSDAQEAPVPAEVSAEARSFFDTKVHPILRQHCYKCHGSQEIRGGLQLTSRAAMLKGGELGPVLDESTLGESAILKAVRYEDLEMPPDGKLSAEQIGILTEWVEKGAVWNPDAELPLVDADQEKPSIAELAKNYWAYQPVGLVAVPKVGKQGWARNAIDRFIQAKLEERGLEPAPEADRRVLIRRLSYDLTGLPPTPQEIDDFLQDQAPDAYERLVDRLLDSPRYGEKWGRHWLDVVHYSETNGYERDGPKANVWRYRDYVIRAFNEDKPYDQFVREQIAGDELPSATRDSIIATAYHRLGLWDDEPADPVQAFYDSMDDVVSTTGGVFLGMSLGCARCHDHKIDPIPQRDYYRFLAYFGNTFKDIREDVYEKRAFQYNTQRVLATPDELAEHERQREVVRDQLAELDRRIAQYEEQVYASFSNPEKEDAKDARVRRQMIAARAESVLGPEAYDDWRRLRDDRRRLQQQRVPGMTETLAIRENGRQASETYVLIRGNAHARGDLVEPAVPELFGDVSPEISLPPEGIESSGRRTALANWLVDPRNPLVSRVIVNRLWQHHFGRGIVATSNDFGQFGDRPTHPELLDWLAHTLMARGWSLKALHRLMVTSATYRMAATENGEGLARDPENYLLWRFNMRRLTAEEVRDTVLYLTGELNSQMGGPSIYPEIQPAYLQTASRPDDAWGKSPPDQQSRRSVYVHVKRSVTEPVLGTFDVADTDSSCPVRFATTVPTQALTTVNGPFFQQQAARFADRLQREAGSDRDNQIRHALELSLCRPATAEEVARGRELITAWEQEDQLDQTASLQYFCLLVLNLNELIYLE
jgi:hypothetical protein